MSFRKLISKYRLSDLVKIASTLSRKLWNNKESIARLFRLDSSRFIKGAFRVSGPGYLTPWHLADIVYYAIAHSSGDFGIAALSENDFFALYNEYIGFDNELSGLIYKDLAPDDALFYMLFGLGQKTFWFQEKHRLWATNFRFYRMLCSLPKQHPELPQLFRYVQDKYRCTFEEYNLARMVMVWLAANDHSINFPLRIQRSPQMKGVDNRLVHEMFQDYVSDYDGIRQNSLEARALYLTPVLRTTQYELLVSNAFLLARKGFTNLYWESRRLCRATDNAEMNLLLGPSFESYVDHLLERYLRPDKYVRLKPRQSGKRADLALFTNTYTILVEQKFAMLNISQQDLRLDLQRVDAWLTAFVQAARQLEATVEDFKNRGKVTIKLILFFDNLTLADGLIKDRVVRRSSSDSEGPVAVDNLFMISIDERERLVQILGKDEGFAERIIAEKIDRQSIKDYSRGVEFDQIMDQMSAEPNQYIASMNPISADST